MKVQRTADLDLIGELDTQAFEDCYLSEAELARNTWWVVQHPDGYPVAYAGARVCATDASLVFMSRCSVMEDWRGLGLQRRLIQARLRWARQQPGVHAVITYTSPDNAGSMRNLIRAGFRPYEAEWCGPHMVYWRKVL